MIVVLLISAGLNSRIFLTFPSTEHVLRELRR
jgi:hypothetical protein